MEPGTTSSTINRKSRSSGRGRFSNRVNRSSSLHDLARTRLDPAADQTDLSGVKWKDEQSQRLPNIGMPGIGTNGRTLSSKSLAVMPGENMMWNNGGLQAGLQAGLQGGVQGGVWPAAAGMNGMNFGLQPQQAFHPMMGSWAPVPGMMGQLGAMR